MLAALLVPALMLSWSAIAFAQGYDDPSPSPSPSEGNQPSVFVRQDPALGSILADPKGMTLYMWANDTTKGESTCYDKCAQNWPPFTASEPLSLPFTVKGELTTIKRKDGTSQIAFNGIPLYYFVKDTEPGQTNGEGVGDVWFVVHPDAQFGQTAAAEATPTTAMTAGTPAAAGNVDVSLIDGVITASATTFTVGQKYTFQVTNNGTLQHEFYIEKAGAVDQPLKTDSGEEAEIKRFDPGKTMTLDFTFTEPGIYQFACHVPGHFPAGMALTIMVVQ
jgi:predicted lipoprotein with Yx(FWY)xxD motif/uncharacterized cupredoxin-like copper-binding protein